MSIQALSAPAINMQKKTIGNQSTFKNLAATMVEKAKSLPGIGEPKFSVYNVRKWFKKQGGKDRSAKEKPFLTADQMKARSEWSVQEKERLAKYCDEFYACFLDEKWFYTQYRW